ncbi:MAG: phosphoribosylglycinamide formyltransferase [Bacteroidota bacterium]
MKRIAILASGEGTNAENLINYFRTSNSGRVVLVLTNKPGAGVIARARSLEVETVVFDREQFYKTGSIVALLKERGIDFIVLAGFLWLVPSLLLASYAGRVINIHPALLPKYGGKGMYGNRVHQAVIENGDSRSGITIHHVNQVYDEGAVIFQASCPVEKDDTPESLASKIHSLEHAHFPVVVEELLNKL